MLWGFKMIDWVGFVGIIVAIIVMAVALIQRVMMCFGNSLFKEEEE